MKIRKGLVSEMLLKDALERGKLKGQTFTRAERDILEDLAAADPDAFHAAYVSDKEPDTRPAPKTRSEALGRALGILP
jgi:hypothetical protein